MSVPLVGVDDFAAYLNLTDMDEQRASQILGLAQSLCESIVSPLPAGAEVVIVDVATRAWTNPEGAQSLSEGAGPFNSSRSYTASTGGVAGGIAGGLYLTRENKRTLRRLVGGGSSGGVFSINVLPATAGTSLPWWDAGAGVPAEWSGDAPADWV